MAFTLTITGATTADQIRYMLREVAMGMGDELLAGAPYRHPARVEGVLLGAVFESNDSVLAPGTHMVDTYGDLPPQELYVERCTPGEDGVCTKCGA